MNIQRSKRKAAVVLPAAVIFSVSLAVAMPAGADDAAGLRSEKLNAALTNVPDGYSVGNENVASLSDEVVAGAPIEVLDSEGAGTGITITEVPTSSVQDVVELGGSQRAVTRDGDTTTVAQQKSDGSVQIVNTIESASATTEFVYEVALPSDAVMTLNEDGSIAAIGADGAFVAGAHKPWALDANGVPVSTHFVIDGTRLTQVVEHGEGNAYPVVADPWLGAELYGGVATTSVPEGFIVTTRPTEWGALYSGTQNIGMWWAHADEVKNKMGNPSLWTESLQEQLYCHIAGWPVSANPDYDLEGWKPYVRWEAQIESKCLGDYSIGS